MKITRTGYAKLATLTHSPILLHNILLVPHITKNQLSVSKSLTDNDVYIEFVANFYCIKARKTWNILLKGIAQKGLYQVQATYVSTQSSLLALLSHSALPKPMYLFAHLSSSYELMCPNFSHFRSLNNESYAQIAMTVSSTLISVDILIKGLVMIQPSMLLNVF